MGNSGKWEIGRGGWGVVSHFPEFPIFQHLFSGKCFSGVGIFPTRIVDLAKNPYPENQVLENYNCHNRCQNCFIFLLKICFPKRSLESITVMNEQNNF